MPTMLTIMAIENPALWRAVRLTLGLAMAVALGWYALPRSLSAGPAEAGPAIPPKPAIAESHRHLPDIRGNERHGGIPLETLRNAQNRLDSVPVENTHGDPVGEVRDVVVGRGGQPKLVDVEFGGFMGFGAEVVPLKADTLGYDPLHKLVLTDMTVKELEVIAAKRDKHQKQASN